MDSCPCEPILGGYFIIGVICIISRLLYLYHRKGGFDTHNLVATLLLGGIAWPIGVIIITGEWLIESLKDREFKNQGYLMRKPTPQELEQKRMEKFKTDVQKVVR